jgi:aryl-alcohol dehydrogenase-like predicted oxidoreductase
MSYGTPEWRPWVLDETQSRPFFERAIEAGINFFDTSDMYSLGVSEEVTGKLVREIGNLDECVIATKVFFPANDRPNMGGLSRKHVQQACEASLRRLGVETIDLYQLHRLDPKTPMEETLRALDDLVRQGKVRHIGMSSAYAWELATALGISERLGLERFTSMQNHYNLVYREEEREMLPLCETEEIAVIPWSPLARGVLAGSRPALRKKEGSTRQETDGLTDFLYDSDSDWDVVEAVQAVAKERGLPPAQIALAWLLSKPGVAAPIVGATKLGHLDDAIAAVEVELSSEEIARLEAPYQPHAVRGLGPAALYRPARRI